MRILDRYIIKSFLSSFLYCMCVFIFLYIIIDLFGHLDEILKHRVPILILQEYYLSMIPFIITQTAPIASLLSTVYVLSSMNRHDEIIAMRAAGISIFRILLPFIFMGIAISIAVFSTSEKVLPASMKNAQSIKEDYIDKEKKDKTKEKKDIDNIAFYGKNNSLVFIEHFDRYNNIASGITILKQDTLGNVISKTTAREGKWTSEAWIFYNVVVYMLDEKGVVKGNPLFFETKDMDMERPKDLISKDTNYEFMSFKKLANYIDNLADGPPDIIRRLHVELHQKISLPFTSLVVILIGASFAIRLRGGRKGSTIIGIGISIIIVFIYYTLMATCIALGKGGVLPPFLSAHLANIVFGLVGLFSIRP